MLSLETLAYAVARGVARAWFDVIAERGAAVREVADSGDSVRADRMRDAVRVVRAEQAGNP